MKEAAGYSLESSGKSPCRRDSPDIEGTLTEANTLISRCTTEEIGDVQAIAIQEAEYRDALNRWENVLLCEMISITDQIDEQDPYLGKDLPDEDGREDSIESRQALLLEPAPISMEGLQKGSLRKVTRPEHLCRSYKDISKQASNAKAQQLRGERDENT